MCTAYSTGVSYMTQRDMPGANWWNYPPPSTSRSVDNTPSHVVMAAAAAAGKISRTTKTVSYQPFDDYFGLSTMLQGLNVSDPIPMSCGHRNRLGSDGSDVLTDDFRNNGTDVELDDFDRIIHRLRSEDGSPTPYAPSSSSVSPVSTSPTTTSLAPEVTMVGFLCERGRRNTSLVLQQQQQQQQHHFLPSMPPAAPMPVPAITTTTVAATSTRPGRRARHGSGGSGGSGGATVCVFCRNNGEPVHVYTAHFLKDQSGRVTCPILRAYKCPYCRASGDNAHTKTYCPLAISALGEAPLSAERVLSSKSSSRSSAGKKRRPLTGGTTAVLAGATLHYLD